MANKKSADFLADQKETLKTQDSLFLRIKVTPNAQKTEISDILEHPDGLTLKVKVAAVPEKGKANQVLEKFFADFFQADCTVVSGQTSPLKVLRVGT